MKGVSADSELESLSYLIIHVPQVCNATFLSPDHYNRHKKVKALRDKIYTVFRKMIIVQKVPRPCQR